MTSTAAVTPRTDEPTPTATRRIPTWSVALGLLALHLVVAFQVRPNPRWNDAIFVLNDARDFPAVPLDHHALRIGNLLPARLFLELFGYGQWAYYAWPLLTGSLLVLATFALGTVLFGRWTGAAAAFLIVFHPVLVDTEIVPGVERMTSWHLLPDIPSTAFVTLGLFLLVTAANRHRGSAGKIASWFFVGAGVSFGYAYLVRELAVFVFPLVPAVLLTWRLPWRRWVQVALPMLGLLAAEMVINALVHGDALARLHVGSEHGSPPRSELTRTDALLHFPREIVDYPQTIVVFATLALTVTGALLVRRRENVLMLGWFVSYWLPITLASGLLDPGYIRLNASLMRYWVPVLPALCLGAAGAVAALLAVARRWLPARLSGATVGVGVACLLVWCVPLLDDIANNPRDAKWNDLRAYLREHDQQIETVLTDDRDARTLGIYQREAVGGDPAWHARIETFPHSGRRVAHASRDPRTVLVWTPSASSHRPTKELGWELALARPWLRLYVPVPLP